MAETPRWVGIDVGADTLAICGLDEAGAVVGEAQVAATADHVESLLNAWKATKETYIAAEAGSFSIHLARSLRSRGYHIDLFDTRQVSKFLRIRQNKTDRNDARGIAEVARLGQGVVSKAFVKSVDCQSIRSQLALRQKLVEHRVALEAAIRSVLRLNGERLPRSSSAAALRRNVAAALERLSVKQGSDLAQHVLPVADLCEVTRRHLERTDRALAKVARANPVCARLMTVHGVGPICALSFYSAIEDPERFTSVEDGAAYLGLAPRTIQSGAGKYRGRTSKMGSTLTRQHLIAAASILLLMGKQESDLRDWAVSLRSRVGTRRATVALARKIAVLLLSLWKQDRDFVARSVAPPSIAIAKPVSDPSAAPAL